MDESTVPAVGDAVMRADGNYDKIKSVDNTADAPVFLVSLKNASREASISLNENGVWQEPWE